MSDPDFDQKTTDYPHGYGRCQCGCAQVTRMRRTGSTPEWVWKSYLEGHEPNPDRNAQNYPKTKTTDDATLPSFNRLSVEDSAASALTNNRISTEAKEIYLSKSRSREPTFGEKTRTHPFGYGYCQCGCGIQTQKHASGIRSMYLQGHVGRTDIQAGEGDSRLSGNPKGSGLAS